MSLKTDAEPNNNVSIEEEASFYLTFFNFLPLMVFLLLVGAIFPQTCWFCACRYVRVSEEMVQLLIRHFLFFIKYVKL